MAGEGGAVHEIEPRVPHKSRVTLCIERGAAPLAAPGPIYGPPEGSINALIWGDGLEDVAGAGFAIRGLAESD